MTFVSLTTLGSLIWNSLFVCAGYFLGTRWHLVADYADVLQLIVIALVAIAIVLFVVMRLRSRSRTSR